MSGSTRITVGIIVVIVVLAIAGYWYVSKDDVDSQGETQVEQQLTSVVEMTPTPDEELSERLQGTTLEGSDAVLRDIVAVLSERAELTAWLANEDLVRRFVAAVHNVAEGVSPRAHAEFLKPRGAFEVRQDGDVLVIDPKSWQRYDVVTEVFTSVDVNGAARLLNEVEPLINEAHSEIAPPGSLFRSTLAAAIDRLMAVPALDGSEVLTPKVVTYVYEDEALEGLSEVERQFLRMGPENVAKIQAKLGELKRALDL